MRSFATILTALSLPLYTFAAHHNNPARRHSDVAVRARGDVLQKRDFSGPLTYYDITVGQYVSSLCPHLLCFIISAE